MMTMKKALLLLATAAVTLALFACSQKDSDSPGTEGQTANGQVTDGEYEQITMAFFTGAKLEDIGLVQEELNKIAREKAGVEITLLPIDWAAWDQQINLMISGGEKLDLLPVLGENYATTVGQDKVFPMDEYLTSDAAKAMLDVVGDTYINASRINGSLYGIPSLRDMVRSYGLTMRKDLVDKYDIDISTLNTIEGLDAAFAKVKAGEPDMYMIYPQGNWHGIIFQLFNDRDPLGDDNGVLMNRGQDDLNVVDLYETEEYAAYCAKIREWFEKGYIPADALTTPDGGSTMIKNGTLFSLCANLKPGYAEENAVTTGYDLVQSDFVQPFATTGTVTSLVWTLPITCENPDKAMEVLSLMYTDPAFTNLIDWGIEGKHYVKVEGQDNMITYPEGVTYDNTGWDLNSGWIFGNQLSTYIWEGNSPDLYKNLDTFNKSAVNSKALGFQFDSAPVKTAVAAVTNVINEYRLSLEYGVVDPAENLPKFITALKDAGMDNIIAEKQRQLDAWAGK